MPGYYLAEADPGPDWVYQADHDLELQICLEYYGDDNTQPVEQRIASHHDETQGLRCLLVALAGQAPAGAKIGRFGLPEAPAEPVELLASTELYLPTADNAHLVDDLAILVRADARGRGIGTALNLEARRIATGQGRDTLVGFSWHSTIADSSGLAQLPGPDGQGSVPLDQSARFAQRCGYSLAQVERQSRLLLPVSTELLAQLRAEAEAEALPAYRVESWVGPTPPRYRAGVAALHATLSTDAPTGEVDWQPEIWDAARVRQVEERIHRTARLVTSVAISASTGEVVGLTGLHLPNSRPQLLEQGTTAVMKAHRGHRLGLLLKVANLQLLAQVQPDATQVDTWNATENDWMLAINAALGYHPYAWFGVWQLKLSSSPDPTVDSARTPRLP